jgi:hypothetical protein
LSEKYFRGKITFINNDKKKATIEYLSQNKLKNIQAVIDDKQQEKYVAMNLIKKPHRFLVGDHVKFVIKKSSANVFFADHVIFEFNNAVEVLINKARITNKFTGYIKLVDDDYFIKEIDSYLFFPLKLSRFEIKPELTASEKPIAFKFLNLEKPEKIMAELYNHNYVPGFKVAVKQFKNEETIEAVVTRISPYGIFVVLKESELEAKISINDLVSQKLNNEEISTGQTIQVKINHISSDRIVIEMV